MDWSTLIPKLQVALDEYEKAMVDGKLSVAEIIGLVDNVKSIIESLRTLPQPLGADIDKALVNLNSAYADNKISILEAIRLIRDALKIFNDLK